MVNLIQSKRQSRLFSIIGHLCPPSASECLYTTKRKIKNIVNSSAELLTDFSESLWKVLVMLGD